MFNNLIKIFIKYVLLLPNKKCFKISGVTENKQTWTN